MSSVANVVSGTVSGTVGVAKSIVDKVVNHRMVLVAIYSGIIFYILSTYELIGYVEKLLGKVGLKVGKDGTRAVHAVIFALFMYYGTLFLLDPLVKALKNGSAVEGMKNKSKKVVAKKPMAKKPVAKKKAVKRR